MKYLSLVLASILWFCSCSSHPQDVVRVGSKDFVESIIIAEIVTQFLIANGIKAVHRKGLGGTEVLWGALKAKDIDVYPEYTGTIEKEILNRDKVFSDKKDMKLALNGHGVAITDTLGFNNSYALGMLREKARKLSIEKISDLARYPSLRLVFSNEFLNREDGYLGLKAVYSFPQKLARGILHSYAYYGLSSDAFDVTDIYTTDAEIIRYDIKVLEDDRGFFPRYDAVVLYNLEVAGLSTALNTMSRSVTEEEMIRLNGQIMNDGDSESIVAARFLSKKFGLKGKGSTTSAIDRLLQNTIDHLSMVFISMLIALLVGLPLGLLAARRKYAGKLILGVVGIIQTIPSLALLVFMLPFFGIGTLPAIVALFLYSLLPIVRQTANGISGINRELRDSASVIGLTRTSVLFRIEIPLASRDILSGVKTATIINIGTAVLGALIGAGGYGDAILTGIRLNDPMLTLQGALPAAVMALLTQGLFDVLDLVLVPKGLRMSLASE